MKKNPILEDERLDVTRNQLEYLREIGRGWFGRVSINLICIHGFFYHGLVIYTNFEYRSLKPRYVIHQRVLFLQTQMILQESLKWL